MIIRGQLYITPYIGAVLQIVDLYIPTCLPFEQESSYVWFIYSTHSTPEQI